MSVVLQSEAAECGLACLAMISGAHSQPVELRDLRRRFSTSLKGTTLRQMVDQAAAIGFNARPLRLEMEELDRLELPCILHWDMNHFVVLRKVGSRRLVVLDPALGERRLTRADTSRHFTGVALELTPRVNFQPEAPAPRLKLSQLTGRVRGLKRSLAQIFVVAAVLQLFALAAPLFSQVVIDDVISSGDRELLTVIVIGFGLLLLVQTAIGLARSWMVMVLGQTLSLQWSGNMFAHLLRLPIDFFERRHLGDIVSRFGAIRTIQGTLTTTAVEAVLDGIMVASAGAMMLIYSTQLSMVTTLAVVAYAMVRWGAYRPFRDAASERMVMAAKENTHFLESLRAITPLKLFGREEDRRSRWQNLVVDVQNRDIRTARMSIAFSTTNGLIFGLENLVVFALGAHMVIGSHTGSASHFSVGMLLAFMAYKTQFTTRVSALIDYGIELRMLSLHAERLADIALATPERDDPSAKGTAIPAPTCDLAHLPASLELKDVSFRYGDGEPWLLRHANLVVEAGQSVAVTGASGCGKTTLLKILLGLLSPTEGEVRFGCVAVGKLGIANVRRQLGTVMQEDVLLTGSLLDNIAFFDEHVDTERAEQCARVAQIHSEILQMPMGYQTLVGDLGTGLSGGQTQRLLLARALYKRPRVLVLDEATSHLDGANERAVTAALGQMRLTRLLIAHRPETIAGAQRVVMLNDGMIVELMRTLPADLAPRPPLSNEGPGSSIDVQYLEPAGAAGLRTELRS